MASCLLNCCCIFPTRPSRDHDTPARTDKNAVAIANCSLPYCVGRWLSSDQAILDRWLQKQIEGVDGKAQPESPLQEMYISEHLSKVLFVALEYLNTCTKTYKFNKFFQATIILHV